MFLCVRYAWRGASHTIYAHNLPLRNRPPPHTQVEVRPGKEGENLLAIHYQSQNSLTDLLLVQKKLFPDGTTLPPFGCGY